MMDALREVTLLLEEFAGSEFRDIYLRTSRYELFVAKPGGAANPLLDQTTPDAGSNHQILQAPHVATVVSSLASGVRVTRNTPVMVLELLGELLELPSGVDGVIDAVLVEPGSFVEYETPLIRIAYSGDG
jgi:acetyl-CoA carboxylase biotin carboxyl carrier protein